MAVSGSRHTLTHHLPHALQEFPGRFIGSDPNDMSYRTRMRVRADSELRIGVRAREMATELINAMPPGSRVQVRGGLDAHNWVVGPTRGQLEDVPRLNKIRSGLGFGLDFVIGAGFQFADDIQNPYLTKGQTIRRSIIAGGGGALLSYGTVAIFCGSTGGIGCVVIAGAAGGIIWSAGVQPTIFQWQWLQPADRNLKALNTP